MLETEKQLKGSGPPTVPVLIAVVLFGAAGFSGYQMWEAAAEAVAEAVETTQASAGFAVVVEVEIQNWSGKSVFHF